MRKVRFVDVAFDIFIAVVMLLISFLTLYPFVYILLYSISDPARIGGGLLLWPKGFMLESYKAIFLASNRIPNAFLVSAARSTLGPVLAVILTSMAAYAMTQKKLLGRKVFIKYFTVTMYFSSGMIPIYLLMKTLHLTGSFWIYIIPYLFSAFNMILIKTYMEGLPASLEESALIDGANDLVLFFKIILPLCKPVIAAIVLFEGLNHWNMYSDTMIYNAQIGKLHTLQYVLMNFVETRTQSLEQARSTINVQRLSAGTLRMSLTVITIIPVLFVYPFLQKYFAKGLLIGSIKG